MVEGRCVDADANSNLDVGPHPDANTDAPGLDAFEPDAVVTPDIGGDGGACSRCPAGETACLDGVRCVECTAVDVSECGTETPACDVDMNECVQCNVSTDCAGRSATPVCNVAMHTCVPCMGLETGACSATPSTPACDADNTCTCTGTSCTTATAARCDEAMNTCAPCAVDTDCTNVAAPNNRHCVDTGGARECRQCNVATEATDCPGGDSCNPTTHRCTGTARESRSTCLTCVADSECIGAAAGTATCAQVNILGVTGNYCLPRLASDTAFCVQPYADRQVGVTSASGSRVTYCRHARTTCEALIHYNSRGDGSCVGAGGADAACGTTSTPSDGYCRLSGVGNRCTIPCNGDDDCRVGVLCNPVADLATGRNLCSL